MCRLKRPLNPNAVRAADDALYAKYPELIKDGKRIPLSETDPKQADLRNEWVNLYKQHGGGIEQDRDKWSTRKPNDPVKYCPLAESSKEPYDCTKTPPRPCPTGSPSYYECRNKDFNRRHGGPPPNPPRYYLNYGKKYAERFMALGSNDLSPEGLKFRDNTLLNLQNAIEKKMAENPCSFSELEMNDDAFSRFAYETHAQAYIDGGLFKLSVQDLQKILRTPDAKDIFSGNGLLQIKKVLGELNSKDVVHIAKETVKEAVERVIDFFNDDE